MQGKVTRCYFFTAGKNKKNSLLSWQHAGMYSHRRGITHNVKILITYYSTIAKGPVCLGVLVCRRGVNSLMLK